MLLWAASFSRAASRCSGRLRSPGPPHAALGGFVLQAASRCSGGASHVALRVCPRGPSVPLNKTVPWNSTAQRCVVASNGRERLMRKRDSL